MIERLALKNFYSFYDQVEISFAVGKQPGPSYYDFNVDGQRLNKAIAVLGPNGSGKTQLLRAFGFLCWFIADSFKELEPDEAIPLRPHAFHSDEKSEFELLFRINDDDYKYVLSLSRKRVFFEALYKKTSSQYSYVFIRQYDGQGYSFKQRGFGLKQSAAIDVKGNSSIISAAKVYGLDSVGDIVNYFDNYSCNVTSVGRNNYSDIELIESSNFFSKHAYFFEVLRNKITQMDLGLSDVELIEHDGRDKDGNEAKVFLPWGVHEKDGKRFKIAFLEESSGTKSAYVLLRSILPVLETGGLAIIDELDNDLHPHMLSHVLDLFKFQETNRKNAQLIFSCHTPEVLNLLKKHQVYLVEKNDLESDAWRLDEVKGLRADDNLYAKYQAGALGAVPNI